MAVTSKLAELRALIVKLGSESGDRPELQVRALELVDELISETPAVKVTRGGAEVLYAVERGANGSALTERRKTGREQPFRCPQPVYDALAVVFADNDRAMPMDEIVSAVAKVLGDVPPDFQVRVPLRLWMQVQPPLIVRNRARYRPVETGMFKTAAGNLWMDLKDKSAR